MKKSYFLIFGILLVVVLILVGPVRERFFQTRIVAPINSNSLNALGAPKIVASGINTYGYHAVSTAPDGNSIAVWVAFSDSTLFGQLFDPKGNPVGGPFKIDDERTNGADSPSVFMSSLGKFVVVWVPQGSVSQGTRQIFKRSFLPGLTSQSAPLPQGAKVAITSNKSMAYSNPSVDGDPSTGMYAIAYNGQPAPGQPVGQADVYMRMYSFNNNQGTTEIKVNNNADNGLTFQHSPTVDVNNGKILIAWQTKLDTSAYAKVILYDGSVVLQDIGSKVNLTPPAAPGKSSYGRLNGVLSTDGSFLLVGGTGEKSDAQYVTPNGVLKPSFVVNSTPIVRGYNIVSGNYNNDRVRRTAVLTFPSGITLMTWSDGKDIKAQLFDSNLSRLGNEFKITSTGSGESAPTLHLLSHNTVMVTWLGGPTFYAQPFQLNSAGLGVSGPVLEEN
ncbi:MAG: hypothetical protein U1C97_02310 [Candidatus Gracilibacteria bacterium]|nr:hypothetical protein [bacterium]MDZ4217130.1 hypothetical protein [Candidatus Gracilibacteria bacterium]